MIEASPWKFFFISCLVCGPVMGLVFIGKDLGTTVLLMVVFFAMLYASGVRLLCLLPWPLIGIPAGYYLIKWFSPYRLARLTTFTDPELTQSGTGYQLWLSLLALGSGNWTGVGFAESRLKHKYLPEAHTDFILSIVGEELCGICDTGDRDQHTCENASGNAPGIRAYDVYRGAGDHQYRRDFRRMADQGDARAVHQLRRKQSRVVPCRDGTHHQCGAGRRVSRLPSGGGGENQRDVQQMESFS